MIGWRYRRWVTVVELGKEDEEGRGAVGFLKLFWWFL